MRKSVTNVSTKALKDCSTIDIINALNNDIFKKLNNIKVNENKSKLLSYLKTKEIDGASLENMTRKQFGKEVAAHTNNTKLMGLSTKLFDKLKSHNFSKLSNITEIDAILPT